VKERIIGENTLRHVRLLDLALQAARAVVRIAVDHSSGSGFMVAPDLVMTNNHVLAGRAQTEQAEFAFDYQLGVDGRQLPVRAVRAAPGGLFYTNSDLDFTVAELASPPDFGAPLRPKHQVMERDERVSIIQHPGGGLKKISMQNNFVAYADRRVVQYYTSTEPGSSGSPVFNDDFEVVAIHHSGGMLEEPGTGRRYLRNEGTSMIAVLADLRANAPEFVAHLTRA